MVANALRPGAGTAYADLTAAQKAVVDSSLDFAPAAGTEFADLTPDQQAVVLEYVRPAIDADWTDLTADQKAVVVARLDNTDATLAKNFFNYNAEPGKKSVKTLTQGPVTDYSNADIYWGDVRRLRLMPISPA